MDVREVISGSVSACGSETLVVEAAKELMEESIGSLCVIDKGRLVGIVTERDFVRAVADGVPPTKKIRDIMTVGPDTLDPDVSVDDAAEWMLAAGYRHLPVTEDDRLLGVVSIKDLLWAIEGERTR